MLAPVRTAEDARTHPQPGDTCTSKLLRATIHVLEVLPNALLVQRIDPYDNHVGSVALSTWSANPASADWTWTPAAHPVACPCGCC